MRKRTIPVIGVVAVGLAASSAAPGRNVEPGMREQPGHASATAGVKPSEAITDLIVQRANSLRLAEAYVKDAGFVKGGSGPFSRDGAFSKFGKKKDTKKSKPAKKKKKTADVDVPAIFEKYKPT